MWGADWIVRRKHLGAGAVLQVKGGSGWTGGGRGDGKKETDLRGLRSSWLGLMMD